MIGVVYGMRSSQVDMMLAITLPMRDRDPDERAQITPRLVGYGWVEEQFDQINNQRITPSFGAKSGTCNQALAFDRREFHRGRQNLDRCQFRQARAAFQPGDRTGIEIGLLGQLGFGPVEFFPIGG